MDFRRVSGRTLGGLAAAGQATARCGRRRDGDESIQYAV
jgi:hypothetical protein